MAAVSVSNESEKPPGEKHVRLPERTPTLVYARDAESFAREKDERTERKSTIGNMRKGDMVGGIGVRRRNLISLMGIITTTITFRSHHLCPGTSQAP